MGGCKAVGPTVEDGSRWWVDCEVEGEGSEAASKINVRFTSLSTQQFHNITQQIFMGLVFRFMQYRLAFSFMFCSSNL